MIDSGLSDPKKISALNKIGKELGWPKTLLLLVVLWLPPLVITIIGFLILNQKLTTFQNKVSVNSEQTNVTVLPSEKNTQKGEIATVEGVSTIFNPEEWIVEKFRPPDSEGFYCHNVRDFQYWSMWSKKLINATSPAKIKFQVKSSPDPKEPPIVFISYGEYIKNKSPLTFYRINLFDTNPRAIRLYNDKNEGIQDDYFEREPDFSTEMTFSVQPISAGPNVSKLILNPALTFRSTGTSTIEEFKSDKEFAADLPTVEIKNTQKQFGIGTKPGTCVKIISAEL